MKKIALLISLSITFSSAIYAQDITPDSWVDDDSDTKISLPVGQNAPDGLKGRVSILKAAGGKEEIFKIKVSDAAGDMFAIRNATALDGIFIPAIYSHNQTDNRISLSFGISTNPTNDTGNEPLLKFEGRLYTNGETETGVSAVINRPLCSWTNLNVVKMQMSAAGNLGIGITSPQAQLHTSGTVRFAGIPTNGGTSIVMADGAGNLSRQNLPYNATIPFINTSSNDNVLQKFNSGNILVNSQIIDNGNNIGIGGSPTTNGKLTIYGTLHMMSDERTKTHIVKMDNALEKIDKLNGYYYEWKENGTQTEVGLLAQEVEKVLPEAVSENEKGTKFLNYDGLIPVLTEAIKEQQKLIKAQGLELEKLKKEVEALKRK